MASSAAAAAKAPGKLPAVLLFQRVDTAFNTALRQRFHVLDLGLGRAAPGLPRHRRARNPSRRGHLERRPRPPGRPVPRCRPLPSLRRQHVRRRPQHRPPRVRAPRRRRRQRREDLLHGRRRPRRWNAHQRAQTRLLSRAVHPLRPLVGQGDYPLGSK
jgi:hypothetical protein